MKKYFHRVSLLWASIMLGGCASLPSTSHQQDLITACTALINYYPIPRDALDARAYANMFTEDGELVLQGAVTKGRSNIENALLNRSATGFIRHIVGSVNVQPVSDNMATGYSYATVIKSNQSYEGTPLPLSQENLFAVVTYEDVFSFDGTECKFSQRKVNINFLNSGNDVK